jgi:hypothetical protein
MGREIRIALMLTAAACLVAVLVDWVVKELNGEATQAGIEAQQASTAVPQADEAEQVSVEAAQEDTEKAQDATAVPQPDEAEQVSVEAAQEDTEKAQDATAESHDQG